MKLTAMLQCWWRAIAHRGRTRNEVTEEMEFHLDARAADLERGGLDAHAARRQARLELGQPETQGERYREAIGLRWLDELGGDLRYAWRMLWRSKGFTAVAVGSLALGIGANTIIFSLAKGVLLDRLAVPHPERLRTVTLYMGPGSPAHRFWGGWFDEPSKSMQGVLSTYPIYGMLQQQNREHPVVEDIFAFKQLSDYKRLTITVDSHAEVVTGEMVSGNFYNQLGVRPQLGRTIEPTDDGVPSTGNVVMISDVMWSRMFGRSPDVIGKTVQLNLIPMTIVGVNPPGFTGAASVQIGPDVFFPLSMEPVLVPMGEKDHPSILDNKDLWWVQMMTRVKPGISAETARAAIETWLSQDIRATMKVSKDDVMPTVVLADGSRGIGEANHDFSMQLYVLSALTGFVLLLACANLANLLLARSAARQREMAVRLALGASRRRVLRQVLTESVLLSSLGGAAGLALGYLGRNVIPHLYSASWQATPLRGDFDWAIFAFTAAVSLLTGVLFGLAPAWQATRVEVNSGLKDAAAASTRRRKGLAGRGLVVVQVALSMLLVIGAGLFAGTLRNLYKEQLGFQAENVLLFSLAAPESRYPAPKDVQLHERMEERLARVPGVSAVTLSFVPMLGGVGYNNGFLPTDQWADNGHNRAIMVNNVGRSFFKTYQIPILNGRSFSAADMSTSKPVGIINQALAHRFYGNVNPVGRTYKMGEAAGDLRIAEIVGVVADAKYDRLDREGQATLYTLYDQLLQAKQMTYAVKTPLATRDILPGIRVAVAEVDKDLPIRDVRTQQAQIDATIAEQRTFAALTGAFGVLALVLACIGIYGLMAYDVARRTNEIGIRMALGAKASQMLGMVLREASWMAAVGIAVGLGGALMLTKYVKSMLYGLAPNDPWILGGAAALLFVFALLAGWGPARRASRVQPMEALRHE